MLLEGFHYAENPAFIHSGQTAQIGNSQSVPLSQEQRKHFQRVVQRDVEILRGSDGGTMAGRRARGYGRSVFQNGHLIVKNAFVCQGANLIFAALRVMTFCSSPGRKAQPLLTISAAVINLGVKFA